MNMLKSHSHILSLFQSLIHSPSNSEQLLFSCLCSKVTLSYTLSISHSLTLDKLNKFCFHLYAQKSLFIGENCNAFSWTSSSSPSPVSLRVHRAGSQLIKIFQHATLHFNIAYKTEFHYLYFYCHSLYYSIQNRKHG